jgi:hypothetical protein
VWTVSQPPWPLLPSSYRTIRDRPPLDARPRIMRPSQSRDRTLVSNDRNLLDSRKRQTASKTRSRWPFCCANSRPHRDDAQRGDRALRSAARSDLSVANATTTKRTGVARGAPSPTKGTHYCVAGIDATSDRKGNASQRSNCVSREGARYIPGDCRRSWAITATGAANRFQESRLRNVRLSSTCAVSSSRRICFVLYPGAFLTLTARRRSETVLTFC